MTTTTPRERDALYLASVLREFPEPIPAVRPDPDKRIRLVNTGCSPACTTAAGTLARDLGEDYLRCTHTGKVYRSARLDREIGMFYARPLLPPAQQATFYVENFYE
jgi:hypothetical protein